MKTISPAILLVLLSLATFGSTAATAADSVPWLPAARSALEAELVAKHGEAQRARIH